LKKFSFFVFIDDDIVLEERYSGNKTCNLSQFLSLSLSFSFPLITGKSSLLRNTCWERDTPLVWKIICLNFSHLTILRKTRQILRKAKHFLYKINRFFKVLIRALAKAQETFFSYTVMTGV
jgi:hypothetical protein